MIERKTECKELKDAVVTLRQLSGDELQQAIYEAELDSIRVHNAEINTAKRKALADGLEQGRIEGKIEGIKEGEIKGKIEGKIEAVIKLVLAAKMPVDEAMKILDVDSKYKKQIEDRLRKV